MFGTLSEEIEVNVSASRAWELYGTLELPRLIEQEQEPNILDKVEVIQGNGGPGTILQFTMPPGTPGITYFKEKFTVVDDETRVKEAEVVEGGYLDMGFTLYRVKFEIKEKSEDWCITKSTIEYELKDEAAAKASLVRIEPLVTAMNIAAKHLLTSKPK